MTYQHKHIPTMTMTIVEETKKGYKCIVTDPKGSGKIRQGKGGVFLRAGRKR